MTDRELDVLVAEKVMGWYTGTRPGMWVSSVGVEGEWELKSEIMLPSFTASISAAWAVGEKLGGLWGVGYGPGRKDWTAYFQINIDHPTHRASDKSAAKAICLAALEAVGVDVHAAQPAQKQGEPK